MTTTESEPTTTTTTAASYCDTLLALLNLLARAAPGTLLIDAGAGDRAVLKCGAGDRPMTVLPSLILDGLESDWHIKLGPSLMSDDGREPLAVSALYARFRPRVSFDRDHGGHHVAEPDAAKIRDALTGFLPPAFIIDALGEVTAWWPLREPLRDMTRARALQRRLAERLGAETALDVEMTPRPRFIGPGQVVPASRMVAADAPDAFVSVAGKCRDVGMYGRWVTITTLDAERIQPVPIGTGTLDDAQAGTYALEDIESALTHQTTTTEPAAETTSRRKGARV
jgi:hypothetical protein